MRRSNIIPICALALLVPLCSCGERQEPQTVAQVRETYSQYFLDGVDYGLSGRIKARAVDPVTKDLLDVTIEEIGARILHAERGEILVNAGTDTISIRLVGVVSADTESGELGTKPMFLTKEIALGFDVTD